MCKCQQGKAIELDVWGGPLDGQTRAWASATALMHWDGHTLHTYALAQDDAGERFWRYAGVGRTSAV